MEQLFLSNIENIKQFILFYIYGLVLYVSIKSFILGFLEQEWEWKYKEVISYPIHTLVVVFRLLGYLIVNVLTFLVNRFL